MEIDQRNTNEQNSTPSDDFITVNLTEQDHDLNEQEHETASCNETSACSEQKQLFKNKDSKKDSEEIPHERPLEESLIANNDESSHLQNQNQCNCGNNNNSSNMPTESSLQVLPISDFSPIFVSGNPNSITTPPTGRPGIGTSIFSFIMTAAFICILWLVVFMIFGYRGHAIAGVFVALFLVGLLINTCFLKLYIRFRIFLGLSAAVASSERQQQRQRHIQERITAAKAKEKPPSYASAVASPPPYDLLQYYKQRRSTLSVRSQSSRASFCKKGHNCPFCKTEVKVFGMCKSCKSSLTKT